MIKIKNKLTVLHDNNSVFADYSNEALDYARDTISITLNADEDYLYIGYYKPVNALYVELATANTNANSFTAQYYNGTTWTSLAGFFDESKGFTRSGFMRWDRNQTDEAQVAVDGTTLNWIRLRPSATHSATVIQGLNIVFSDDQDLKKEYAEVVGTRYIPSGENSHILSHVAARDEIIQEIRKDGRAIRNLSTGTLKKLDAFDLLDVEEIRMASTYLTLSKIMTALSDQVDDVYSTKAAMYRSMYSKALNLYYMEIDFDDDGEKDENEEQHPMTMRVLRR